MRSHIDKIPPPPAQKSERERERERERKKYLPYNSNHVRLKDFFAA